MIALHVARERDHAIAVAHDLIDRARSAGLAVVGCDATDTNGLGLVPLDPGDTPRAVVAVGGDGTVLEGISYALATGASLAGVNVGRVGFLAETEPEHLDELVAALLEPEPVTFARMGIRATLDGVVSIGLNDVVIQKSQGGQMVAVDIDVDDVRFLTYRADGVIVSTPTGSSAYTLSAGGPLVDPRVDALVVTPIAPYSLFRASVALHPDAVLRCTIIHDRPAAVSIDGRDLGIAEPGTTVVIERGPSVPFLDVSHRSYPEALKAKLRLHEGLDGVLGETERR